MDMGYREDQRYTYMIGMIGIYWVGSVRYMTTQPYTKTRTSKMLVF